MKKNILVTGGAGFIGSHVCLSLLENNFSVTILDSEVNSSPKSIEKVLEICNSSNIENASIKYIKGDIRNQDLINSIFDNCKKAKNPIFAVIHLAGLKAVDESLIKPLLYWDNNISGIIKLLEVMDHNLCRNFIFSSSATIYGQINNRKLIESDEIKPINPYGYTKATCERILEDIYLSLPKKWKIINLRYFNPIGAHNSGKIGEFSTDKPKNIFPHILKAAKGLIPKLEIFGSDWPTFDGTCIRDYIHIMDLAEAHLAALIFLFKGENFFKNFNIGTGKGTSVLELVKTFEKVNNCSIPITFSERRKGDIVHAVADNTLAKNELQWNPKRSLQEVCEDGWRWVCLNPNGY